MPTRSATLALLGVAAALALYGCSSGGGDDPSPRSSSGAGTVTAACSIVAPAAAAVPTPSVDVGKVSGRVGVLVSQSRGEVRPRGGDARLVAKALEARGLTVETSTPGSALAFVASAQQMIDRGAKVLIVDPIDNASGVQVEAAARRAGVDVIDYDRLTQGGSARYFVSFDAESIGRMQAEMLVDCLAQQGVTDPRVIILDGGTDVDNGAVLQDKGVHEVLDPLVAAGRATIEEEAAVKGWRAENAGPSFTIALDAAGGTVDGVVAASDGIAHAVIAVLARSGRIGDVALTGQGSGRQGLRQVVTGRQSMTVWVDPRAEAAAAAGLAATLVSGRTPWRVGLRLSPYADPWSPGRTLEALLLPGQVVTRANVQDVVDSGAVSVAEVCRGIPEPCAALGLH